MNKIQNTFREIDKALIPYICAGDPDLKATRKLIFTLENAGADIIELGIPFSDPLADGPVIQAAGQRALDQGVTLAGIFQMVSEVERKIDIPLVLMGYYNSILNYGKENFIRDCSRTGIAGVIVPDLPYKEDKEFYEKMRTNNIAGILLAAPNTPSSRLQYLGEKSSGFLYCVSLLGVTGDKKGPFEHLEEYIDRVRKEVDLPLGLGFGIDGPQKAAAVSGYVDGVIMGSAIIEVIKNSDDREDLHSSVKSFVAKTREVV